MSGSVTPDESLLKDAFIVVLGPLGLRSAELLPAGWDAQPAINPTAAVKEHHPIVFMT
jgi:hypothetical protein